MLKKHAPLLVIILSLFSIQLSSETFNSSLDVELKVLELKGLKIQALKREAASVSNTKNPAEPPIITEALSKTTCAPIEDLKNFKDSFIQKNKAALKKILGPWYLESPKDFKFEYSFYENMEPSALYSSGLHAAKRTLSSDDENELNRYTATNIFYKLFYHDRLNADTMFYIYDFYRNMKVDSSTFKYLKIYLKESTKHESLSLKANKEIIKLSKDPESLLGAFAITKDFPGLSFSTYRSILKELDIETQIALAKEMIKLGADKNTSNANMDWSPGAHQAAYKTLEENDLARSYSPLAEVRNNKAESSDSFMDKLSAVKTSCDLEEAWSIASSVIREL